MAVVRDQSLRHETAIEDGRCVHREQGPVVDGRAAQKALQKLAGSFAVKACWRS